VKRILLSVLLAFVLAGTARAAVEERAFQLRYRSAADAVSVVEPLLSPEGSVMLQPRANTVVIRDVGSVIDKVAVTLRVWDHVPFNFRVRVKFFLASTSMPTGTASTAAPVELGPNFGQLFHFRSYTPLDDLQFVSPDGSSVEANVGERYVLRFTLRTQPSDQERLILSPLELLSRAGAATPPPSRPLLRSTVSLRVGQTAVLAAAHSERAKEVLLVVVTAAREGNP